MAALRSSRGTVPRAGRMQLGTKTVRGTGTTPAFKGELLSSRAVRVQLPGLAVQAEMVLADRSPGPRLPGCAVSGAVGIPDAADATMNG